MAPRPLTQIDEVMQLRRNDDLTSVYIRHLIRRARVTTLRPAGATQVFPQLSSGELRANFIVISWSRTLIFALTF